MVWFLSLLHLLFMSGEYPIKKETNAQVWIAGSIPSDLGNQQEIIIRRRYLNNHISISKGLQNDENAVIAAVEKKFPNSRIPIYQFVCIRDQRKEQKQSDPRCFSRQSSMLLAEWKRSRQGSLQTSLHKKYSYIRGPIVDYLGVIGIGLV